ncbi:YlmC/YmxH family sporulation protein [Proteinivorax hydrogeniformans]|uniref:YlmC/YmxH family sporulation protein n=1 Tax=Proteinivorax hydrogeniformans TaxID=1826727 RepID=A0AAU8HRB8_9FIRM
MRISDLREREIVNLGDGKVLGHFDDLEINADSGQIKALIVTGQSGFLGLMSSGNDYIIPWNKIKKIGQDVIIIDTRTEDRVKQGGE